MTTSPRGTGGDQVERILDARRPSDAEILTTRPLLPTPARWERVTSPAGTDGTRRADHLRLVAANTCGVTATVPVGLAPIVRRFDGTTTIDEAVSDAIDEAGAHARTEYDITAATVAVVRHLVMTGLASLTPG